MFYDSDMMKTNYMMEKMLDVESMRRKVIANNIANVDVPHFKRSEVNFESELKRVIKSQENESGRFIAQTTDERHIPFYEEKDIRQVAPRMNLDYSTTGRNDGNNVDIEKEMVDSSKNTMRYNAFVTNLNQNYKILKLVMRPVG
jgi:flagellar basal-body rod protein FlgB